MLRKLLSHNINVTKNLSFFFRELQPMAALLLIYYYFTSWSTWFIYLKVCVGFPIFDSVSFLLNFEL